MGVLQGPSETVTDAWVHAGGQSLNESFMPIGQASRSRMMFASRQAVARFVVCLFSMLALVQPAGAEDSTLVPGTNAVREVLTGKNTWVLAFTTSAVLEPLNRWPPAPTTVLAEGAKLRLRIKNPFLGIIESDVTLTENGFTFTSPVNGQIVMLLDPTDSEHPFKGQRKNGYTYWLIRQQ